ELLAAVASDQVVRAGEAGQPAGDDLDDLVTDLVSVLVVDVLEVIDVDHHRDQSVPVAPGAGQLPLGQLEEVPAACDAGQVVDRGQLLDLREEPGVLVRDHRVAGQASGDVAAPVVEGVPPG